METEEFLKLLSDNQRLLILLGGVVSFISLFQPFSTSSLYFDSVTISGLDMSISDTSLFWVYLIALGGMYYGYFQGYGEKYPHLFLAVGGLLLLLTFFATQIYTGDHGRINLLYGFFLELIGSLAVTVGGYYYYESNKSLPQPGT